MSEKEQFLDKSRIYVIVTPIVKIPKGIYRMEPGRIMAQVAHASSKLKFGYALSNNAPKDWMVAFYRQSVTTIVLLARDQKELLHINNLTILANPSLYAEMYEDDNEAVYGTKDPVLTAVAIGPTNKDAVVGICDYLPKYE
jgi:peptidyl-tRNA hydrolase